MADKSGLTLKTSSLGFRMKVGHVQVPGAQRQGVLHLGF